jgi:hypothetical protein
VVLKRGEYDNRWNKEQIRFLCVKYGMVVVYLNNRVGFGIVNTHTYLRVIGTITDITTVDRMNLLYTYYSIIPTH